MSLLQTAFDLCPTVFADRTIGTLATVSHQWYDQCQPELHSRELRHIDVSEVDIDALDIACVRQLTLTAPLRMCQPMYYAFSYKGGFGNVHNNRCFYESSVVEKICEKCPLLERLEVRIQVPSDFDLQEPCCLFPPPEDITHLTITLEYIDTINTPRPVHTSSLEYQEWLHSLSLDDGYDSHLKPLVENSDDEDDELTYGHFLGDISNADGTLVFTPGPGHHPNSPHDSLDMVDSLMTIDEKIAEHRKDCNRIWLPLSMWYHVYGWRWSLKELTVNSVGPPVEISMVHENELGLLEPQNGGTDISQGWQYALGSLETLSASGDVIVGIWNSLSPSIQTIECTNSATVELRTDTASYDDFHVIEGAHPVHMTTTWPVNHRYLYTDSRHLKYRELAIGLWQFPACHTLTLQLVAPETPTQSFDPDMWLLYQPLHMMHNSIILDCSALSPRWKEYIQQRTFSNIFTIVL